ncbi:MAG: cytochrome b [Pseudomonadota bacterium]
MITADLAARERYSRVAQALHWIIALLIIGQVIGGVAMTKVLPKTDALTFEIYQLHKSFGITILLLSVARLGWRLTHRPPALPAEMPTWQKRVSHFTHVAFYGFMIAIPLSGWAMVSVSPYNIPTVLFEVIPWPHLPFWEGVDDKKPVEAVFKQVHELLGLAMVALLALHIGAALKHHFKDRDGVLARMVPGLHPPRA